MGSLKKKDSLETTTTTRETRGKLGTESISKQNTEKSQTRLQHQTHVRFTLEALETIKQPLFVLFVNIHKTNTNFCGFQQDIH